MTDVEILEARNITLACDINAGRLFAGENPALPGGSLEFNVPHLVETLDQLGCDTSDGFFMQAEYGTGAGSTDSGYSSTVGKARLFSNGSMSVHFTVGGDPGKTALLIATKLLSDLPEGTTKQENIQDFLGMQIGLQGRKIRKADIHKALSAAVEHTHILESEADVQETVIHELQHIADYKNPDVQQVALRHNRKYKSYIVGGYVLALVGTAGTATVTTMESGPGVGTCVALGFWNASSFLLKKVGVKLQERRYLTSPKEIRARATEAQAASYPQIVSFIAAQPEVAA